MNDNLQKLYNNLIGTYDLPDFETFKSDMQDDVKSKKLYDNLVGSYDLPDYDTFISDMGLKKKVSTEFLPTPQNLQKAYTEKQKDFSVVPSQSNIDYQSSLPKDITIEEITRADKARMSRLSETIKQDEEDVIERTRREITQLESQFSGSELKQKKNDLIEMRTDELQKVAENKAKDFDYDLIQDDVKDFTKLFKNVIDSNNDHNLKVQQISELRQNIINQIPEEKRDQAWGEVNRLVSDLLTQSQMGQQFLMKNSLANTLKSLEDAKNKIIAEANAKMVKAGIDPNEISIAPPIIEKEADAASRIQTAIGLIGEALRIPESKSGAGSEAFRSEIGNILTAGVFGTLRDIEVAQSAKRQKEGTSTEADDALINAYGQLQELQSMASQNIDRYRRVKSIAGSIPYMEQFLISGGIGEFAQATAAKAGQAILKDKIKGTITKQLVKRVAEPVIEGTISMVGRVPISPMTYQNIAEASTVLKKDGNNYVVDKDKMPTLAEAIGRGTYKSATEIFSESLGGALALPKWKALDRVFTPTVKKMFTRVGMNNPFGEYGEEIAANLLQGEKIDKQFLGDLLTTVPIITGGFAVLSTPAMVQDIKMAKKELPKEDAAEIRDLIDAKNEEGLTERVAAMIDGKPQEEVLNTVETVASMVQDKVGEEIISDAQAKVEPTIAEKPQVETKVEPLKTEGTTEGTTEGIKEEIPTTETTEPKIEPQLLENDYELSKETQNDVLYDISKSLGFKGNQIESGYARKGNISIRIKDHSPEWGYFNEDINNGVKKIINITVGDYENTDARRNKTSLDEIRKEHPNVEFIDIQVEDGSGVNDAIRRISKELKIEPKVEEETKDAESRRIGSEKVSEESRTETGNGEMEGIRLGDYEQNKESQRSETQQVAVKGEEIAPTYFHATNKGEQIRAEGFKGKSDERSIAAGIKTEGVFLYPNDKEAATEFTKNLGDNAEVIETKINGRVYDANVETKYGWEQDKQITEVAKDENIINQLRADGYVGITSTELGQPATFVFNPESIELKPEPKQISQNLGIEYKGETEGLDNYTVEVGGETYNFTTKVGATEEEVSKVRDEIVKNATEKPSDIEATIREIESKQPKQEPPPSEPTKEEPKAEEGGSVFERETLRKFRDESTLSDKFKQHLKDQGISTTRLPNDISKQEVDYLIATHGVEKASEIIRDMGNNVPSSVRSMMAVRLAKMYDTLAMEAERAGNIEDSGRYMDKAIDIANWIGERATELGRGLQALGSTEVLTELSPKTLARKMQKEARKQRDKQLNKSKSDIDSKSKKLKKAQEESIDDLFKDAAYQASKSKVTGKERTPSTSVTKEKLKKEKDLRANLWGELKKARQATKDRGQALGFAATPAHAEEVRIAGEIVRSLIRSGYYKIQDIVEQLQKEWKKYLNEDLSYKDAESLIPKEIDGKDIDEALGDNLVEKATNSLVKRIERMLKDPTIGKKDPIVQMVNTLYEKVRAGDKAEKMPKDAKSNIDKVREAIVNKKDYADVWERAKNEIEQNINSNPELSEEQKEDYNNRLENFYKEVIGEPYSPQQISKIVKEKIKDLDIKIDEVIKDHYTVYDATRRTLQEKLIDEVGLSEEDAAMLAESVGKEFDRIATAKKRAVLMGGIKPKETIRPKPTKEVWQKLIELTNLGAWSNPEFSEAYADKWGMPKLTDEQAKTIEDYGKKIQEAPEGYKKFEVTQDMLGYVSKIEGLDVGDMMMAMWYASILSGFRTQFKNVFANTINTLFELAISMRRPTMIPSLFYGLGTGYAHGAREAMHVLHKGYAPITTGKLETPAILEQWKFKGGAANPLNWGKVVRRVMVAADVFSYYGLKEMRAWELAMLQARSEDSKAMYPNKKQWGRAAEILYRTKERRQIAEEKAKEEGISPRSNEFQRRVWEVMEQSRPMQMEEETNHFASRGTFNHMPEGTLGFVTDLLSRAIQGVAIKAQVPFSKKTVTIRPVKFIVPFTRIISNVANTALDYTPYALERIRRKGIGLSSFTDKPETKRFHRDYTKDERQREIAKMFVGVSAMITLYVLSGDTDDDDKEPVVRITANGTGDYKKNYELKENGQWQSYSIKIGGKWYSYQYTPLFLALAPIGYLRDAERYQKEDIKGMSNFDMVQTITSKTMSAISDMSWLASVSGLLEAMSGDNISSFERWWEKMAVSTGKSVIYPKIAEQTVQMIDKYTGVPRKDATGPWAKIMKDMPLVRGKYNDMLNAVGEPVLVDPQMMIETETQDPFWNFIVANDAWIGKPSQRSVQIYDSELSIERGLTDDEYYDYIRMSGQSIKSRIMDEVMPKDLSQEEIKREVDNIKTEERKRAREAIAGWRNIRMDNPELWKKLLDNNLLPVRKTIKINDETIRDPKELDAIYLNAESIFVRLIKNMPLDTKNRDKLKEKIDNRWDKAIEMAIKQEESKRSKNIE